MENSEGKLSDSDEHKLLELYKELGSDVRHFDRHVYIVNFQMLPALVIGLLVLYGRIKKLGPIEFENSDDVYVIVWIGCLLISLMWIIAVSRFAQVFHIHMKTRRQCEGLLGLNGHSKIAQMDKESRFSKWLGHYRLRLFGFWVYFSLLLIRAFRCPYENFIDWFVRNYFLCGFLLIVSGVVTFGVCSYYFKKLDADYGSPLYYDSPLLRKSEKLRK